MVEQWVKEALEHAGISQAALARALTDRLGRSIDRAAVNKMVSGQRRVSSDEMLAISDVTKFAAPVEGPSASPMLPILSWVQAGELTAADGVMPFDDVPRMPFAGLPPGDWFGLTVEGDSMDRISPPESVILVNRRDRALVPNACYVFTDGEGAATYKRYRPSPRRLEPVSTNPVHEPIFLDIAGEPQVIGRVRYTLLKL